MWSLHGCTSYAPHCYLFWLIFFNSCCFHTPSNVCWFCFPLYVCMGIIFTSSIYRKLAFHLCVLREDRTDCILVTVIKYFYNTSQHLILLNFSFHNFTAVLVACETTAPICSSVRPVYLKKCSSAHSPYKYGSIHSGRFGFWSTCWASKTFRRCFP